MNLFSIGDNVTTKKPHACGGNSWEVLRVGADYKIKCLKCGHVVMLSSDKFYKAVKNGGRTGASTTK